MKFPPDHPLPPGTGIATRPPGTRSAESRVLSGGIGAVVIDGPVLEESEVVVELMGVLWEALSNENIPWAQRPGTALTLAHAMLQRSEPQPQGSAAIVLIRSNSLTLAHTGSVRVIRVIKGGGTAPLNRPFPVPWRMTPAPEPDADSIESPFLGGPGELRLNAPRHPVVVQTGDRILLLTGSDGGTPTPWSDDEALSLAPEMLAERCLNASAENEPRGASLVLQIPAAGITRAPDVPENRFQRGGTGPTTRVGSTLAGPPAPRNDVPQERPRLWLAAGTGLGLAALLFSGAMRLLPDGPTSDPPPPAPSSSQRTEDTSRTPPPEGSAAPVQEEVPADSLELPTEAAEGPPATLPTPTVAQPIGDRLTRGVLRSPRNILDVLRGQYRQRVISAENPRQPRAVNSSEPAALTRALALPEKDTTMDSPQWQGAIALRASRIVTLLTELIVAENLRDLRLLETRLTSERGTPAHRATFQAILDQKPEPIVADWALIHMGKLR